MMKTKPKKPTVDPVIAFGNALLDAPVQQKIVTASSKTLLRDRFSMICNDLGLSYEKAMAILSNIGQQERYEALLIDFTYCLDGLFAAGKLSPNGAVGRSLYYRIHLLDIKKAAQEAENVPPKLAEAIESAWACYVPVGPDLAEIELIEDLEQFLAEEPV